MSQVAIEYLSGSIERVTFHSEESGFCVLKVKTKGRKDLVTVVGQAISVSPGEYLDCQGNWINDREYGLQFRAAQVRIVQPSTLEGIEKYLGSGFVKGIGPQFAKKLVKAFGLEVFEVIEKEPQRLREISGFGQVRRERIIKSWHEQKVIRQIVVFLQSHGVGTQRAVRIYKTYGEDAIAKVRENPYRLALDIRGIGFKTADTLAQRLGVPRESLMRAEAGVRHVLQEICDFGHCASAIEDLTESASQLLEIPEEVIREAIAKELANGNIISELIEDVPSVFLAGLHRAEVGVATHIKRLLEAESPWFKDIQIESSITWVQEKTNIALSPSQRKAATMALKNKMAIITGGPGVGKTTLINSILKILRTKTRRILLGAPTGRAAKRLSESTGLEAKTLHRLLEFDPKIYGFKRNETNPLEADLIVIDEMSMVDLPMMYNLLKAIPATAVLLLVGDVDQLPSVGPGAILGNLIDSQQIATIRLTEIFRQAARSEIIMNAHLINKGKMPNLHQDKNTVTDFYFVEVKEQERIPETLLHLVAERIPKRFGFDPLREIQVLVPMNRGSLGVRTLNMELQKQLNSVVGQEVTRFGWTFKVGDKVIQTVNNYTKEIFNGDIGFITEIKKEDGLLRIRFEERIVDYEVDELDELSLAYAVTIHKSQGSEYPVVVLPIAMQHYTLLERNLLYTGVTRGKSLVVIVGQARALWMAIKTVRSTTRLTNLTARLIQLCM
jgi:exodeoxyribonuclease V alpha subunit